MTAVLHRVFLAGLRHRPLSTGLSLLAVALGVALGLAVQLIHGAAVDEFDRSLRLLAGVADLEVVGPRAGFDDALFVALAQRPEVSEASPVVEVDVPLAGRADRLTVVGIDVFRAARLQPALLPAAEGTRPRFDVLDPGKIFLTGAALAALRLEAGDRVALRGARGVVALEVAGGIPGFGAGRLLGIMDIAAVQRLFGLVGRVTRIDLRLAPGVDAGRAAAALRPLLPAGVGVLRPAAARAQTLGLSRAYRVNLAVLAAIALLTGAFLVFSTQWLAVVRRRPEFAFLRAMGVGRRMLATGVLAEGAFVGALGGLLGVALGHVIAAALLHAVGGDLGAGYFQGVLPRWRAAPLASAAYLLLGVAASVTAAALPARHAVREAPARGLRAADSEAMPRVVARGWPAVLCAVAAAAACLAPPLGGVPVAGYAAVAFILAAAAFVLPGAVRLLVTILEGGGVLWRLARGRLAASPGQAVAAAAGIMASVALAAAMAIMVGSFRDSVEAWLGQVLPADLYARAVPAGVGSFDAGVAARVAALAGVAEVIPARHASVRLSDARPPVTLIARPVPDPAVLPLVAGGAAHPGKEGGQRAALPPAWVSEAVVDLYGARVGDRLVLPLGGRAQPFRIAGVWRDYVRQQGAVIVELARYRESSGDGRIDELAVRLAAGADPARVAGAIERTLGTGAAEVAPSQAIRARTLAVFDRTFLVTYLMEAAAVGIGLFGVATTFAALASARRREFGLLRHLGLTRGEIGRLLALEGALCAGAGVVTGLVAGGAIAWVLVEVVNRQSFHWSMGFQPPVAALALFALSLLALAGLAARLAGARAMRGSAVRAVREDW